MFKIASHSKCIVVDRPRWGLLHKGPQLKHCQLHSSNNELTYRLQYGPNPIKTLQR